MNFKHSLSRFSIISFLTLVLFACNKEDVPAPKPIQPATGLFVLCEGNIGTSNSKLGFYDLAGGSYSGNFYKTVNGSDLGDNANNAVIYGSKIYIAIDNSGLVNVLEMATGKLLASIPFKDGSGATKGPRRVVPFNGKVYVPTIWGKSLELIDTTTLKVTSSFGLTSSAEDVAFFNNQAYVVLQGNYKAGYDSTIAVLNPGSGAEIKKIKVGVNPGNISIDKNGNLFVSVIGDYNKIQPYLAKVDASGTIVKKTDGAFAKMQQYNNQLYIISSYGGFAGVRVYDLATMNLVKENFITDGTTIKSAYGLNIDEVNGNVYVTDALNYQESGKVYAFDQTGKLKFSFTTSEGVNPNTVLFKR